MHFTIFTIVLLVVGVTGLAISSRSEFSEVGQSASYADGNLDARANLIAPTNAMLSQTIDLTAEVLYEADKSLGIVGRSAELTAPENGELNARADLITPINAMLSQTGGMTADLLYETDKALGIVGRSEVAAPVEE